MIEAFADLAILFPNALIGGAVMAVACSLVGVFVVLKRIVFIGVALSETAACGIAAAMLLDLPPLLGATVLTASVVAFLAVSRETGRIPGDAILGVVFLSASALSILLVAKSGFGLHEIKAMLYGDLILAGPEDRDILLAIGIPAIVLFLLFVRPVFYAFLDPEASRVMGVACRFWELAFFFLLGLVVSAASKSGGVLLVFCYLVAPPVTALLIARNLPAVLAVAASAGVVATLGGLTLAYRQDWPGNQTIIAFSCALLAAVWTVGNIADWIKAKTKIFRI